MRLFGWLVLNWWHPLTYEFVCLVGFRTRYKRHLVVEECVGSSFPQNGCPAQRGNMAVIISKFVAGSRANITLSQEIRIVLTMSWFVRVKERFLVSILSISSSQARRPNRSVHFFIFFWRHGAPSSTQTLSYPYGHPCEAYKIRVAITCVLNTLCSKYRVPAVINKRAQPPKRWSGRVRSQRYQNPTRLAPL